MKSALVMSPLVVPGVWVFAMKEVTVKFWCRAREVSAANVRL